MLRTTLRKTAAILMLVSFIFGTAAPAAASPFITWSQFPNNSSGHPNRLVYNGTNWVKIAANRIVMSDANPSGPLLWQAAINWGNNYNGWITDSYESKIKNGTRLLSKSETDAMGQAGRAFGGVWWTSTKNDKYSAWVPVADGSYAKGDISKHYNCRNARAVLFLKNIDANVYYLSAYSGGAKGALGAVTTAADSKSRMKFTYKDTTLAAPTIGGGALTLDAAGTSTWYTNTANRVAATVGNADPIAAAGYLFMKDAATATLTLGGAGTYTGEAELYLHSEIVGTNYDRMGTASTNLKSLGLKFTYANGKLTAMTLSELYGTEANAITLNNGFELTLSGDSYAQDITAASGGGTLIS
ncbi:MAG: hypothetical protein KBS54_05855, partial [Synergistaceae bacterium]|nr:hypothetical protein [Candidatus Equadaptatus faecalis]